MAKVLLMSVVYEPDTVSTASMVAGLARRLAAGGHDVTVLSSVPNYNPSAEVRADRRYRTGWLRPFVTGEEDGLRVVRCYMPQRRGRVLSRAADFAVFHACLGAAAVRCGRGADVAIVVSPPLTMAAAAFLLRPLGGTRVIYNVQELWPDVPRQLGLITNPVLLGVLGRLERVIYRNADAVVPIGEGFASVVRERGARADRVVVIPNFVDATWIAPRPKRNALSEAWGLDGRPVVLYAGNIGLTQDFDLLLDAAERLPGVDFVVVGGGAGLAGLEQSVGARSLPNVQLRPFVAREHVADLYGAADVVAVPLKPGHDHTTMPSKVFSAMASGKPVLASAGPGTDVAELLAGARAGVSVAPGDVGAFVAALAELLGGGSSRWDRASALATARRYSPEACAAAYDELVRSVVSSSTSA
ncbi:MAG: glycosyltransferase family 4 protein [Actinobacteria bacterium]|nr:glycosyltransferase family 4 protein [Actinomycetota bacterium]